MHVDEASPKSQFEHSFYRFLQHSLHLEDLPEKTILYSDINKIRHIFYLLRHYQRSITVESEKGRYRALVSDIQTATATLQLEGFQEQDLVKCQLHFALKKDIYNFEVSIRRVDREQITILIPDFIKSEEQRKEVRIAPDNCWVRLTPLHYPISSEENVRSQLQRHFLFITREIEKEDPDLSRINRIIVDEVRKLVPHFLFKLYDRKALDDKVAPNSSLAFNDRLASNDKLDSNDKLASDGNRVSDATGWIEKIIFAEGKPFYISNVSNIKNYYQISHLAGDIPPLLSRENGEQSPQQFLQQLQAEDRQNLLSSYAYLPLWLLGAPAGYIKVYTTIFDRNFVDLSRLLSLTTLATALSYAMSKTIVCRKYYRNLLAPLIDIGENGLSLRIKEKSIFDFLQTTNFIKLFVETGDKVLQFCGKISRFSKKKDGYHLDINFSEAFHHSAFALEDFIYRQVRAEYG